MSKRDKSIETESSGYLGLGKVGRGVIVISMEFPFVVRKVF